MKSIALVLVLFLSVFMVSPGFAAIGMPRPLASRYRRVMETSQDDPLLQKSLRKVLHEMNVKLNRSSKTNGDDASTSQLKLFFVSPSPVSVNESDYEEIDYSDESDQIYLNGSNQLINKTWMTERKYTRNHTNFDSESGRGNKLKILGDARKSAGNAVVDYSKTTFKNDIVEIQHENQTSENDKVMGEVDIKINKSRNDGNIGSNAGKSSHMEILTERSGQSSHKANNMAAGENAQYVLKEKSSNLNAVSRNLNIKYNLHNHSDSDSIWDHGYELHPTEFHNRRDSGFNATGLSSRRSEIPDHSWFKSKDHDSTVVPKNDIKWMGKQTFPNLSSRGLRPSITSDEKTEKPSDLTRSPTMSTQSSTTESSNSESHGVKEKLRNTNYTLSDPLKKEIEKISEHFQSEDSSNESVLRDLSKFLPRKGNDPEEQGRIDKLRKFFSRPNILNNIGIEDENSESDFDIFKKVLRKLNKSKIVRESSFYPILTYYLRLEGSDSPDYENDDSDEPWYTESLIGSFASYLFDYAGEDLMKDEMKAKINFWRKEFQDDSETDSEEYDYGYLT